MAVETDLTTTLRITPQVDKMAVDALADQIAGAVSQRVGSAVGGAAVGGPRAAAGAGSTTVSTAQQAAPAGAPIGSSSTTSTAAGGGGAGGGGGTTSTAGGGFGGGGGGGTSSTAGAAGPMGPGSRRPASYYMAGDTMTGDARYLAQGIFGNRVFQSAIGMASAHAGSGLMEAARERARIIEDARQSGTPEDMLPTMGALRFAGPIGAATSVAAQALINHIDQGLSDQERISQQVGQRARTFALARQAGAVPNYMTQGAFFSESAGDRYGGMSQEAATAAAQAFSATGYYDPRSSFNYRRLMMTGVSAEALASFRAPTRLGVSGLNQNAAENLIGIAQAGNLTGSAINELLSQIAANTRSMAMRGVNLNIAGRTDMLNRALSAGIAPEIANAGMETAGSNVRSLKDQFLSPYKAFGDAMVWMRALSGARNAEDVLGNFERIEGNDQEIADILRPGGRIVGAAYYRTGLRNALNVLPAGRGPRREVNYLDAYGDEEFRRSVATSRREASLFDWLQPVEQYERQQQRKQAGQVASMQDASNINAWQDAMTEAVLNGNTPMAKAMADLMGAEGPVAKAIRANNALLEQVLTRGGRL